MPWTSYKVIRTYYKLGQKTIYLKGYKKSDERVFEN